MHMPYAREKLSRCLCEWGEKNDFWNLLILSYLFCTLSYAQDLRFVGPVNLDAAIV